MGYAHGTQRGKRHIAGKKRVQYDTALSGRQPCAHKHKKDTFMQQALADAGSVVAVYGGSCISRQL